MCLYYVVFRMGISFGIISRGFVMDFRLQHIACYACMCVLYMHFKTQLARRYDAFIAPQRILDIITILLVKYSVRCRGGSYFVLGCFGISSCQMTIVVGCFWYIFLSNDDICHLTSLWPSDVIWRQGSRSTLAQVMTWLPDGTKPLPEPMLTNDQWGVVAFTW